MAAIARSCPQPLEKNIMVPTQRKYQYVRMKEMLSNALAGSRGRGLFAVGDAGVRGSVSATETETAGGELTEYGDGTMLTPSYSRTVIDSIFARVVRLESLSYSSPCDSAMTNLLLSYQFIVRFH